MSDDTPPAPERTDLPIGEFETPEDWARWLEHNHAASRGLWLKIAKKASALRTVTYAEALDVALCYGWIDGQKGKGDADHYLQRFTPRGPRSRWSQINRSKATALIERGEMKPAGMREVEKARADGRWDAAYEPQSSTTVPEDLQRALDGNEAARTFFDTLNRANRYAILYRIGDTRNPDTRARRIAQFVQMLAEGKKLHP